MNNIFILIALFGLMLATSEEVIGQNSGDFFTETPEPEESERSWRVFGALTKSPEESPLFLVDDIFHLQAFEEDGKKKVKFKPAKMKNSVWKNNSNLQNLNFDKYPSAEDPVYLCAVKQIQGLGRHSGQEFHRFVISKMAGYEQAQIAIQYEHVDNPRGQDICEGLSFPSHGGLAHAHAVR